MTEAEMDLVDFPTNFEFVKLAEKQMYLWKMYQPTTIEADFPFADDWWKYVYWIPKIKKEFYLMSIQSLDFETGLRELIDKYGMDYWYFITYYDFFLKRLEWMRKQGSTHVGEIKHEKGKR